MPEPETPRPRWPRGPLLVAALCVLAVLVAGGTTYAVQLASAGSARREATAAAHRFLATWATGDLAALPAQTVGHPAAVTTAYAAVDHALGITPGPKNSPIAVRTGAAHTAGSAATVPATVTIDVPGLGTWRDDTTLRVRTSGQQALVDWSPAAIAPGMRTGDRLVMRRSLPRRAPVLGSDGRPLPATADVAALTGAVAPATPAQARTMPGVRAGDPIGVTGLQSADDAALRGTASGTLTVVDAGGHTTATLARWTGTAPRPVTSTVNPADQSAAARAIAGTGHPSALVAIDTRTGAVLAAASTPAGYPRALLGRYPPGSTFKMVTLTAALMAGRSLSDPTACTPTATVAGYTFRNAGGESFGSIPLKRAFAVSCNTAFIHLAETLPSGELAAAARLLGCDTGHAPLQTPSYGCSYPATATGTAYAASAIGQGTVLVSPLAIASIAAAADAGTWQQPHLTPGASPASHPLPAAVTAGLRQAMRAVVTSGTGTPADLPGTPVYGKTGTAEHGTGSNPPTDAWFAAFRGTVAVAVLVEDAGFGETAAVPVAAQFLRAVTR